MYLGPNGGDRADDRDVGNAADLGNLADLDNVTDLNDSADLDNCGRVVVDARRERSGATRRAGG